MLFRYLGTGQVTAGPQEELQTEKEPEERAVPKVRTLNATEFQRIQTALS